MKRVLFVLVLMAAVAVLLSGGEASARSNPEGYVHPKDVDPDDHSWGGENRIGGEIPCGSVFKSSGMLPLDIFINLIMFDRPEKSGHEATLTVTGSLDRPEEDGDNGLDQVVTHRRGN